MSHLDRLLLRAADAWEARARALELLELVKIPYTGSGVQASSVAIDTWSAGRTTSLAPGASRLFRFRVASRGKIGLGLREEAEVLILDEPTASIDAESEHQLFLRFRELAAGRTAIVISHRFSTVRMADRIAVLQGGRLAELGSHAELMSRGGRYAHLFALQAQGYAD